MNKSTHNFWFSYGLLIFIVAIKFVLQFYLVNPVYELHRDEFLHLGQADHLAWGYISVPPFTSWISKIIFLLGGGIFWVRFFPALFGALTVVVVWQIAETLQGKTASKVLAASAALFSPLVRLNILYQPNSFDILAWTLIFYFLIRFIQTEKISWLFCLTGITSLGFYNKYNVVFLLTGILVGLVLSYRKIFSNPFLWKAFGLLIIFILPNIVWQITHHFPVLEHMKALKASQLVNNSYGGFMRGQLMFFLGSLPLTIAALVGFVKFPEFKKLRFTGITFITTLSIFALLKAKDYYAVGLYPALFAFGSVYLEKALVPKIRLIVLPFLLIANLFIFVSTAKIIYPLMSPEEMEANRESLEKFGVLRWEDGKNHHLPQDFADMIGWRELAEKSLAAYQTIPQNELDSTLVFCDNYGQTGALNHFNRGKMKEAYSFNTDYIYWLPPMKKIKNILLIGEVPDPKIINLFSGFTPMGEVKNENSREKGTAIFLLTDSKPGFTERFFDIAQKRKVNFEIF